MYDWVTHTWNIIKGECPHGCSYCYMKRRGKQPALHFDDKELNTDLGEGNFIFVGSSCDIFSVDIPDEWVIKTLNHCKKFNNRYLFQTKNPAALAFDIICGTYTLPAGSVVCTTIETNRYYPEIMHNAPMPEIRVMGMVELDYPLYVTIEPIIDFDLDKLIKMIERIDPVQVNIGADSGGHKLPEPPKGKIFELISLLEKFTKVVQKKNLKRLIK